LLTTAEQTYSVVTLKLLHFTAEHTLLTLKL
jgi:hypothetical protein